MHFESLSDFFAMGGYAFYVWLAYGITGLALVWLVLDTWLKRKQLTKSVLKQQQRQQRQQAAKEVTERL